MFSFMTPLSKVVVPFYTPTHEMRHFGCSTSLSTLDVVSLSNFGYSGGL